MIDTLNSTNNYQTTYFFKRTNNIVIIVKGKAPHGNYKLNIKCVVRKILYFIASV